MKILKLGLLTMLLVGLAACNVEVTSPGSNVAPEVTGGSVETDFTATLNGEEQQVICQDEETELTYTFDYTGDLTGWTSYLRGRSGATVGRESFKLSGDNRVRRVDDDTVSVTYILSSGAAPLLTEPGAELSTQAITVVPDPEEVGETQVVLELDGADDPSPLGSSFISVIRNCPERVGDDEEVELSDLSVETDFTTNIGDGNEDVICNNLATSLKYTFSYSGNLTEWESYLRGEEAPNSTNANVTLNLFDENNAITVDGNEITVRYTLNPGSAPVDSTTLDPQAIVVTPTLEGYTRLYVVVDNETGEDEVLISDRIAVVTSCEAAPEPATITESSYTTKLHC